MLITFQIIILLVLVISFMGIIGEKKDKNMRDNMTKVFTLSTVTFFITLFI